MCVVASPPEGQCEQWSGLCPGRQLVVADVADVDDFHTRLCTSLWNRTANCGAADNVTRIVSSPGGLERRLMRRCRTLTVPWLSHARSPIAAMATRERPIRVAFAAGVTGHILGSRRGFMVWRRKLRDACRALHDPLQCTGVFQSLAGGTARSAVELYARSTFCLQPPGDTLVRTGMVDALSVGCIPVLFHPAQAALWPTHWHSHNASVLFDWTGGHTHTSEPEKVNASHIIHELLTMPQWRVQRLQAGVVEAARGTFYRGSIGPSSIPDAVDILVDSLLRL